jgi:hypothetical protein
MALISHEVPLDLLDASLKFNDYHYCLPHLLENEQYYQFFKSASERGDLIIMDNGLFEGVSHTIDQPGVEPGLENSMPIRQDFQI